MNNLKIVFLFLGWRLLLFILSFLAFFIIKDFGGRFPYSEMLQGTNLPSWVWSFGNFDGVHYLRIALNDYSSLYSQAFFPLYPLLVKWACFPFISLAGNLTTCIFLSGFLLANIFLLLGLLLLRKLLVIDYDIKTSLRVIILLLTFPTAFFFGAIYSESLFLFLAVVSLLLLRKKLFLFAGITIALAAATRIFGLMLIPVFLLEAYDSYQNKSLEKKMASLISGLLLTPLGLLLYMFYQRMYFNNPLMFITSQPVFGASREINNIVLLPQVVFRYLKILMTVQFNNFLFFNALLELIATLFIFWLLVVSFRKIRFSYWVFSLGCFLLPTLTGTLSSMPRYILMDFLLFPVLANLKTFWYRFTIACFIGLQILLAILFLRGYWVG